MVAKRSDMADLPDWPRMLSADQAAAYCGMSDEHLRRHCPVGPLEFGKRRLYDRRRIDQWLDDMARGHTRPRGNDFTEAF